MPKAIMKVVKGGSAMRDPVVDGFFIDAPEAGKRFRFYGPPVDAGAALRYIHTSPVLAVTVVSGGYLIVTRNSTYRIFPAAQEVAA